MFFANDWRYKLRDENPDAPFGHLGKLLGEKWGRMSPEEKAPYELKEKAENMRYHAEVSEMARYEAAHHGWAGWWRSWTLR
jgi:hypothetical protein